MLPAPQTEVQSRPANRKWLGRRLTWIAGAGILLLALTVAGVVLWRSQNQPKADREVLSYDTLDFDTESLRTQLTLDPTYAQVQTGGSLSLVARVTGDVKTGITWEVAEGDEGGRVVEGETERDTEGTSHLAAYTAPTVPGLYHIIVTSKVDKTKTARAEMKVRAPVPSTFIIPGFAGAGAGPSARPEKMDVGEMLKRADAAIGARNYPDALHWYTEAAHVGNARAQFEVAEMYFLGKGVSHDFDYALRLYRQAADQKYAPAQHALGVMYENGVGVPKDMRQAQAWYQKARQNGYKGLGATN